MTDSSGTERLPRLLGTREHAARKIADRIRDFERLLSAVSTDNLRDLEDDTESKRQYTVELLRSLFDSQQPAMEFDRETSRSVFYANTTDVERRARLGDDLRQCINQLRSLTARLEFYQQPMRPPSEDLIGKGKFEAGHAPSLAAILLFLLVLIGAGGLVLWQRANIAGLSAADPAGAVFFVIISLIPAILLFGLFHTVARVTGKLYGLPIELGGPAALFIIVFLILLRLPSTAASAPPSTTSTNIAAPRGRVINIQTHGQYIDRWEAKPGTRFAVKVTQAEQSVIAQLFCLKPDGSHPELATWHYDVLRSGETFLLKEPCEYLLWILTTSPLANPRIVATITLGDAQHEYTLTLPGGDSKVKGARWKINVHP